MAEIPPYHELSLSYPYPTPKNGELLKPVGFSYFDTSITISLIVWENTANTDEMTAILLRLLNSRTSKNGHFLIESRNYP